MVEDDAHQAHQQIADKIAQQLEQTAHATRIKKLLLYACKNRWENDLSLLSVIRLQSLVQDLRQSYPTLNQLHTQLKALVAKLNKKDEYFPIVEAIVAEMAGLYPAATSEEVTRVSLAASQRQDDCTLAEQQSNRFNLLVLEVATTLEQDTHLNRVKKLMLSAAQNAWETDPFKINHTNLRNLIRELLHSYPTLDELGARFAVVVKSLNKPIEYALIAEKTLRQMARLYAENTFLEGAASAALPDYESSGADEDTAPELAQFINQAPEIQLAQQRVPLQFSEAAMDLVDVRLEIMKYANPLRAKILLFSVIYHPFVGHSQDWANLKLYSLDGLLRSLTAICPSLEEMRSRLHKAVQQLNQPDEYADVADVMIKCLQPIYPRLHQQFQQALPGMNGAKVTRASTARANYQATDAEANH